MVTFAVSTSLVGIVYKIKTNRKLKILSPCSYVILHVFIVFQPFYFSWRFQDFFFFFFCVIRLWSELVRKWIRIDCVCHYFMLIHVYYVHCLKLVMQICNEKCLYQLMVLHLNLRSLRWCLFKLIKMLSSSSFIVILSCKDNHFL